MTPLHVFFVLCLVIDTGTVNTVQSISLRANSVSLCQRDLTKISTKFDFSYLVQTNLSPMRPSNAFCIANELKLRILLSLSWCFITRYRAKGGGEGGIEVVVVVVVVVVVDWLVAAASEGLTEDVLSELPTVDWVFAASASGREAAVVSLELPRVCGEEEKEAMRVFDI